MLAICLMATILGYVNDKPPSPDKLEPTALSRALRHERSEVLLYANDITKPPDRLEPTSMLRNPRHERSEVRSYTLPMATCAPKAPPLDSVRGFRAPSTLPNPARVGCAPGPCRPRPALKGALLPRAPQRQGLRAPTPTPSVPPLDQSARPWRSYTG